MKTMRDNFEALPEIAKLIKEGDAFYCDKGDWYLCKDVDNSAIELALETAWYAFQEQQKKIDAVLEYINDEKWMDEYGDYHCPF